MSGSNERTTVRPPTRPTMEDVAARAGVSRALVSLVMREAPNVSDHRRAAVLAAAEELGYRPNHMARSLASRSSSTIGLLLSDLHNPFFAEVADSIGTAAREAGLQVVINTGSRRADYEQQALENLLGFQTAGIVLVGPVVGHSAIEAAARTVPTVVVTRVVRSRLVDTVMVDDRTAGRLVVEHLTALGHERIAHIDGGTGAAAAQRRQGYIRAMTEAGLADHIRVHTGEYTEAAGSAGAGALLRGRKSARPTAIYAANDLVAAGALDRVAREGLGVPENISLVGYDNTALAALAHISLTTVHQPREEMGRLAVAALLERIDGRTQPVRQLLAPTLMVRRTTGRPH